MLRNIKKEGGKSGQLESQWGTNLTTVFQFKFMRRHFTSSPVKFQCWFKMFWLLVCRSFVSFIIPKSFKPGQRFGFFAFQTETSTVWVDILFGQKSFLLNSGLSGVTILRFSSVWGPNWEWEERELLVLRRLQGSARPTLGLFMGCGD